MFNQGTVPPRRLCAGNRPLRQGIVRDGGYLPHFCRKLFGEVVPWQTPMTDLVLQSDLH